MEERRIAANRIYTAPQEYVSNHIVKLRDGVVTGLQPLTCEQERTEWLGGIVVVTPCTHIGQTDIHAIEDFYPDSRKSYRNSPEPPPLSATPGAYHLSGIASDYFDKCHKEKEIQIHVTKL